jgi:hypothetical protein
VEPNDLIGSTNFVGKGRKLRPGQVRTISAKINMIAHWLFGGANVGKFLFLSFLQ